MYNNNRILAVIPARKGSKRIPGKNLKELCGRPLIEWTILAAKNSKYLDDILVTSDDPGILEIARKNKVIDYKRNQILSSDNASSIDVVVDVVDNLTIKHNIIILLQPTSPLRQSEDIDSAVELFYDKKADCVISVCETDHPIQWMNSLPEDNSMANFMTKGSLSKRSQDLDKSYRLNGALYLIIPEELKKKKTFFIEDNIFAYIMPRERSIDIDQEIDFKLAEILLKDDDKRNNT